ncbi:ester cyclase [Candidatus Poribacteria bacterium]
MRRTGQILSSLIPVIVLMVFVSGCGKQEIAETEANKAIQRRAIEQVWNQKNLDLIDELHAPESVLHDPAKSGLSGPEGYRQFATMYQTAFPDVQFTIEDQIAAGDKVAIRWTATGTHQAELMGIPPTGVHATTVGITINRIVDGKIVGEWPHWDALGQMQQLGVIPPGRPTPEDYMWGTSSEATGDPGDPTANKAIVNRFIDEVWNQGKMDAMDEIVSTDTVGHTPTEPGSPIVGIEASKQAINVYRTAFPDLHLAIEDMLAEGDKVLTRWTSTGTHQGELMGIPPTGKQTVSSGIVISRIADGKIVENWWAWDALGLMQQLTGAQE